MIVVMIASPSATAANPSIVTDRAGDALHKAPGFLDIVGARVAEQGGTFSFQMSVAAQIPAAPPRIPPDHELDWTWALDTESTSFPSGYPFPASPGQARPAELSISVAWTGGSYSAYLLDRRPLLSGGDVVITQLAFAISGTDFRVDVGANLLGNPSSFGWGAVSFYWSGHPGSAGGHFIDALEPFYNAWAV